MTSQCKLVHYTLLAGALILTSGALAQDAANENDEPAAQPNTGKMHLSLGADFSNAYFFRGYLQNKDQINSQFWMDVGIDLAETGGTTWTANLGIWNAFDDGDEAGTTDSVTEKWYESDLYFGLGFEHDQWAGSVTYIYYTSPAAAFDTLEELIFTLGYDDTEHLGDWAMNPSITLAIETEESADGFDKGVFLGIGIEPGFGFESQSLENLSLSFPAEIGLSISDYYQDDSGDDETFGYFQVGAVASFDLPISQAYGNWSIYAGVHALFLGDTTKDVNDGDSSEFIGTAGLSIEY